MISLLIARKKRAIVRLFYIINVRIFIVVYHTEMYFQFFIDMGRNIVKLKQALYCKKTKWEQFQKLYVEYF